MTPTIPVVWKSFHDSPHSGYWDQSLTRWVFEQPGRYQFQHSEVMPETREGIVLVTPGHWRNAEQINADLEGRPWALVIITSDEEAACPFWLLNHPNRSIWKHWPNPELPWQPDRILPLGWTPGTLEANSVQPPPRDLDWFFSGQITHPRREQAAIAMRKMTGGKLIETAGFTQGVARSEFFEMLRRSKVIPCPSGPNTPDTFRFYEALESGAVPLADATSPRVDRNGDRGHWARAFGDVPFPVVENWQNLPDLVEEFQRQDKRIEVLAWWELAKRDLVNRLHDDIQRLSGDEGNRPMEERITVLMPTSPIPSHPSTEIIEETIESVRAQLPHAEIIVMADGVRPELEHRREAYEDYLESLIWVGKKYRIIPLVFPTHQHQANMTRRALELVRSELVLFVEHDTPLTGDIPWKELGYWILNDDYNLIRLHYDTEIHPDHQYLMRGSEVKYKNGYDQRFMKTVQWSQRPHLARTEKYRNWIGDYFAVTSNSMVEDGLYGFVANSEWETFRLAIYHPNGSIQRSRHLDGRAGDSKFPELMRNT